MAVLPETIHVLLVDDEQLSRFVVGNLLRKCNYAVTVVDSGAQALELLSRSSPGTFQLILTDLMMPDVDGLDVLRFVRNNSSLKDLPVVMMSANEQKDTVFQAIKGGAEEYLIKPVTKKEVQNIWQYVWKRLSAVQQQQQALVSPQQQQQQLPAVQQSQEQGQQQLANGVHSSAASANGPAATAAAGAAAAVNRTGAGRGVRHLQQQQKLLQQQHAHNQQQQQRQSQQQQQQSQQQQELLRSMQLLHRTNQLPAVVQPDRNAASHLHSRVLQEQQLPGQQQQGQSTVPVNLQRQQQQQQLGVSLQQQLGGVNLQQQLGGVNLQQQQQQQQQQASHQEDLESLAFFLSTLHSHRAAEAAAVKASVAELDTLIAQVQAALGQLQQQQPGGHSSPQPTPFDNQAAGAAGLQPPDRPGSAGSASIAESAPHRAAAEAGPGAAAAAGAAGAGAGAAADKASSSKRHAPEETEDDDDLEMDRRERSRRHKRSRLDPSQQQQLQQQQQHGVAADTAGQVQLLRRASSTLSGVQQQQLQLQEPAAAPAAAGPSSQAQDAAAAAPRVASDIAAKWQHVSSKFDTLQAIYSQHKQAWQQQQQLEVEALPAATAAGAQQAGAAAGGTTSSSRTPAAALNGSCGSGWAQKLPSFLQGFGDDLWGYSRYSRLAVRGTVRAAADLLGGGAAMVSAAAFDRDDEYVATAGVSKRIRIFEYRAITSGSCGAQGCTVAGRPAACGSSSSLSEGLGGGAAYGGTLGLGDWTGGAPGATAAAGQDMGVVYPVLELSSRSRLSCVAWSPYVKAQLASSDHEGVVQLWDANTGSELMQLEEHSKRAWAVDFSRLEPTRLVSSSDDGTVKLWSIHQESSVATLQLHANVCSVQFSPESPHLLAAGCANYRFYLYDLRNTSQPLVCVPGHRRAVSYVRWLDGQQLVTASTDNSLRRWSVPELLTAASSSSSREIGGSAVAAACKMTYRGHTNNKNFIGLAVLPGAPGAPPPAAAGASSSSACGRSPCSGYIVCGSETNEAHVYHSSVPLPVAQHSFHSLSSPWGHRQLQQGKRGSASDLGALADLADSATGSKSDLFVSCVAFNRRQGTIVAANSAGHIQVLELA